MLSALIRATAALAASIAIGYAFGFRFDGGAAGTCRRSCAIALLLSLALSLGADALGSVAGNAEAAGQTLLIPQLLLVMLSTGIAPAEAFPGLARTVRAHISRSRRSPETLRGLAVGAVRAADLLLSLAWCVGLLVVFGAHRGADAAADAS